MSHHVKECVVAKCLPDGPGNVKGVVVVDGTAGSVVSWLLEIAMTLACSIFQFSSLCFCRLRSLKVPFIIG